MAQSEKAPRRDFITKEIFILITPFLASYLWTIFYEAGFAQVYGIPYDFIDLKMIDVMLTNRLTLIAATIGFLWIGLYYNLIPNATSPLFKSVITLFLIVSLSLGFVFGHTDAVNRTEYVVLNTVPESVIIKIYGDKVVSAPFDREKRVLYKSFTVHRLGDDSGLTLSPQSVGPLEVLNLPFRW